MMIGESYTHGHCEQCMEPGSVNELSGLCEAHEFQRRADEGLEREGLTIAVGEAAESCEQCEGLDVDENHFSWSDCDICRSSLGGDRLPAHGISEQHGIIHYEICIDCAMYIANGELPE